MALICESKRLVLRTLDANDAAFVLELVNEPAFQTNIADKQIHTLDKARTFIEEGAWTNQPVDGFGQFAIELKATAEVVGICGLLYREDLDLTDVGFALLKRHWGNGFALEAAKAVMTYGERQLGLEQIAAIVAPENHSSIRVLEKLGMKAVGPVPGENKDGCFLYL